MEEILKTLGITKSGVDADTSYVIDIDTYEEYMKFFNILETAEDNDTIDQLDENSVVNVHTTDIHYTLDTDTNSYEISLMGDLDQDLYKLVITKIQ